VNFSIENWKSFKDKVTFSMLPTPEEQHTNRIPRIKTYDLKILPIASVYGGNASGKSNFVTALSTLQSIIVYGIVPNAPIPVDSFCLDDSSIQNPSLFEIEFLADEKIYRYTLSATKKEIIYEELIEVGNNDNITLYERHKSKIEKFGGSKKEYLEYMINNNVVRNNQPFLRCAIELNFEPFFSIWNWFRNDLIIILPHSKYTAVENFVDDGNYVGQRLNDILQDLDTGISRIGGEIIDVSRIDFSPKNRELIGSLPEGRSLKFGLPNELFVATRKNGQVIVKRLTTYHKKTNGTDALFGLKMESDGSKRAIDIVPAIIDLLAPHPQKVCIIDEIDRSLHTSLTEALIRVYLNGCSQDTKSQLLITTHDVQLINQEIFRNDEIWFTERKEDGASDLFSLGSFEGVQKDKDIRKSYLQGRFGGVPNICTY
jgi:AAA15 family ATPase/GTPase